VVTGSRIRRSDTVAPSPITNVNGESLAIVEAMATEILSASSGFALAADFEPMRFETRVCAVFAVE
jgi:hypothetical protein